MTSNVQDKRLLFQGLFLTTERYRLAKYIINNGRTMSRSMDEYYNKEIDKLNSLIEGIKICLPEKEVKMINDRMDKLNEEYFTHEG